MQIITGVIFLILSPIIIGTLYARNFLNKKDFYAWLALFSIVPGVLLYDYFITVIGYDISKISFLLVFISKVIFIFLVQVVSFCIALILKSLQLKNL